MSQFSTLTPMPADALLGLMTNLYNQGSVYFE